MRLAVLLAAVACSALTACSQPAEAPAESSPPAASESAAPPAPDPTTPTAEPRPCEAEIGRAAADRLAERCRMVSPATRPPCNVANPCEMIQGEIDRACAQYGPDEEKPAECAA